MSDGREEREEQEKRRQLEEQQDPRDRVPDEVFHDRPVEWEQWDRRHEHS